MRGHFDKNAYMPGETAQVVLELDNRSKSKFKCVLARRTTPTTALITCVTESFLLGFSSDLCCERIVGTRKRLLARCAPGPTQVRQLVRLPQSKLNSVRINRYPQVLYVDRRCSTPCAASVAALLVRPRVAACRGHVLTRVVLSLQRTPHCPRCRWQGCAVPVLDRNTLFSTLWKVSGECVSPQAMVSHPHLSLQQPGPGLTDQGLLRTTSGASAAPSCGRLVPTGEFDHRPDFAVSALTTLSPPLALLRS